MTANPLLSVCSQLAALYNVPPVVHHPDPVASASFRALLAPDATALWSQMATLQRDTLAIRECLIRAEVVRGRLRYRIVHPHRVAQVLGLPDDELEPGLVREWRWREVRAEPQWTLDELDIRDPSAPRFVVRDQDGADVTQVLHGSELSGDRYPYRRADGTPILPYVLFHARAPSQLWDYRSGAELVAGTLSVGTHWTMYAHALVNASWPQRYMLDAEPVGVEPSGEGSNRRSVVVADPATVLMLRRTSPEAQAQVGQWQPGASPELVQAASTGYEARVQSLGEVGESDFARSSGDPRSAYALLISRESRREAARRYAEVFRSSDRQLLDLSATLARLAGIVPPDTPETGHSLTYRALPLSADERRAQLEDQRARYDLGLVSRVDLWLETHPGATPEQAIEALEQVVEAERLIERLKTERTEETPETREGGSDGG
jgi:hypothetical protein